MKIFIGEVTSKKMQKTATVAVTRVVSHSLYKKRFKRVKKYHVHDEIDVKVGQRVKFIASKPYSKTKKWKIIEVVDTGKTVSKRKSKTVKDKKKGKK